MASDVSEQLRRQVAERAYHVCEYRLIHEDDTLLRLPGGPHHQPQARGPTEPANLAWASACWNNNKGSDLGTLVGDPPQLVRLFHPRTDRWDQCFHLNGIRIEAAQPAGEATVKLLQLNHDTRLREREALAEAARYPSIEALARMKE